MRSFLALCVLFLAASAVHAGVVFETVDRDTKSGKRSPAERWFVQSGSARIEGVDGISIFRDGAVLALDTTDKTYHVMDQATMEQLSARVKQKRAVQQQRMQAELAKLPPEKRAAVEARMEQQGFGTGAPKKRSITAKDTGRAESVSGRSCEVFEITRDDVLDEQYCVASFASLPGGGELQALLQKYQGFIEQMSELMAGGSRDAMRNEFELWRKLNGFPLITRSYADGRLETSERAVNSWKSQDIPAAMFEVPSNYTKRDLIKDLETAVGK